MGAAVRALSVSQRTQLVAYGSRNFDVIKHSARLMSIASTDYWRSQRLRVFVFFVCLHLTLVDDKPVYFSPASFAFQLWGEFCRWVVKRWVDLYTNWALGFYDWWQLGRLICF